MRARTLATLLALLAMSGCLGASAPPAHAGLACERTPAGADAPWLVDDDALMPPPPPADDGAPAAREGAQDETPPTRLWSREYLRLALTHADDGKGNPPRQARQIAILETTLHDTLMLALRAQDCHRRPAPDGRGWSYPDEHAAVAGAAASLLAAFFPGDPTDLRGLARELAQARVENGAARESDVEAGLAMGEAAARAALVARVDDGHENPPLATSWPTGDCAWRPTPPAHENPVEPGWGRVLPFVLDRGDALRPPPPPACGSDEFVAQTRALYDASRNLTQAQRDAAVRWAGSPPLAWLVIALEASQAAGLDARAEARLLAHVGAALHDAGVAAWDAKFAYWSERPITTIRREWDPAWEPVVATPSFPGYVSGHSVFSGAASRVLGAFLPAESARFDALAHEAMMSRFWGGIHIMADNEEGMTVGRAVGEAVVARAGLASTSPTERS